MKCLKWVVAFLASAYSSYCVFANELTIDVWYGDEQRFGHLGGHPQRWVNVLGAVSPAEALAKLEFSLNGESRETLSFQEDNKRIAETGDFNVEILRSRLRDGSNRIEIYATNTRGEEATKSISIDYRKEAKAWPLPYSIEWSKVSKIEEAAQVVDGDWKLTPNGVRTVTPYYDRVLAFGDATWENYEVTTSVIIHGLIGPKTEPNRTNVTHVAIASRWPGHDPDGNQPTVKWHPLGATAEFRLGSDLSECRWRIFDGQRQYHVESERRRVIKFETPYGMKHRVETLSDGRTRYRVKFWELSKAEPEEWDFERFEPNDLKSGSALLLAHFSDATFGNVQVVPIEPLY